MDHESKELTLLDARAMEEDGSNQQINTNPPKQFNFQQLSIGMSSDYLQAVNYGASFVRIGSAIFGSRS